MTARAMSRTTVLLAAAVVAGAAVRLAWLDRMEFKFDEVHVIELARQGLSRGMPLHGMMSGAGVRNPPGFLFALMPVTALTDSPLAIGALVAVANIAALAVLWRAGCAAGWGRAGLWAAGLAAAHPWLILFSRKIWAQSLLPLYVSCILWLMARCALRRGSRAVACVLPLACLAWQTHFSASGLSGVVLLWVAWGCVRGSLNRAASAAGALLAAILLAPYALHLAWGGWREWVNLPVAPAPAGDAQGGAAIVLRFAQTALAGGFGAPFAFRPAGLSETVPWPAGLFLESAAIAGTAIVVALCGLGIARALAPDAVPAHRSPLVGVTDTRTGGVRDFAKWLLLLVLATPVLYAVCGVRAEPHYFIVTLPPLLLLAGVGAGGTASGAALPRDAGRLGIAARALCAAAIVCGFGVWLSVFASIVLQGGTGGDYGLAYSVQRTVAGRLSRAGFTADSVDATLTRDRSVGVFYLMARMPRGGTPPADTRVKLVDNLLVKRWFCGPGSREAPELGCGPLRVVLSSTVGGGGGR